MLDKLISRFGGAEPIELTIEEELAILSEIDREEDLIECGSSRVVYAWRNDFVVKVAMAEGGRNQNLTERQFYRSFYYYGIFAPIHAYGRMINIMTRLDECGYYEEYDLEEGDEIYEALIMANELTEYDGGDNGQIGYNQDAGCWQLYDYVYSNNFDREVIVDDVSYWLKYKDPIEHAKICIESEQYYTRQQMDELCEGYNEEEGCE